MSRRLVFPSISAGIFVLAAGSLASGAEWLSIIPLQAVPIPAGNLVAAVLYISLAALTVFATRPGTVVRAFAWLLLAAAVLAPGFDLARRQREPELHHVELAVRALDVLHGNGIAGRIAAVAVVAADPPRDTAIETARCGAEHDGERALKACATSFLP